jgi:hypothetical protein
MVGQSRSGASAEIDTDIEPVRLNRKRKDLLGIPCHFGHFKKLLVVCLVKIRDMPGRRDEQMPIVIREAIHHCDTVFGTPQDEIIVVILWGFDIFANEALAFVGEALDVSDSPRSPKIFAFQFIYTSMRYGRPLKKLFPGDRRHKKLHCHVLVNGYLRINATYSHRQRRTGVYRIALTVSFGSSSVYVEKLLSMALQIERFISSQESINPAHLEWLDIRDGPFGRIRPQQRIGTINYGYPVIGVLNTYFRQRVIDVSGSEQNHRGRRGKHGLPLVADGNAFGGIPYARYRIPQKPLHR